ncbi:MAG: hypothetical protein CMF62_02625 [Magnetococcales bacterium]|nr:hypothetical protein [Magnetococcales bacterium]|tara:strand:- start:68490 stop:69065 length:576 start_codon:yes stop_codon:yes gene_type:complete
MNKYNNLQTFESISSLQNNCKKNDILVEMIHHDLNKMTSEEMKRILSKCYDDIYYKRELLRYEFFNRSTTPEKLEFKDFIKQTKNILSRYHHIVGGFLIEDREWRFYDATSTDYNLDNDEVYFENTIDRTDDQDRNTLLYLERLIEIINMIATNIKVRYKIKHRDQLSWIVIRAKNNSKKDNDTNNIEISL